MAAVSTMQNARVGIVLATYNCDRDHFTQQIQSIQQQDFPHWFCLITDDGSAEEIQQFMTQLIANDQRFIYHAQAQNLGAYHNFEYGIRYFFNNTSVTHVAFADQDDIWRSHKLRMLLTTMTLSGSELAHSDLSLIDEQGNLRHPSVWQYEKRHPEKMTPEFLLLRNTVTGCTVMIARSLIPAVLPFPKQQIPGGWHHDHWLALVAAYRGQVDHVREPLVQYRQHCSNVVGAQKGAATLSQELSAWIGKKGKLGLKSYRIHRDLSQAFFHRFYSAAERDRRNPFSDRTINFGWPILWLGLRSLGAGYGVSGATLRLFVNKFIFDIEKLRQFFTQLLFDANTK